MLEELQDVFGNGYREWFAGIRAQPDPQPTQRSVSWRNRNMTSNTPELSETSVCQSRGTRCGDSGSGGGEESEASPDSGLPNCLKWAQNLQVLLNDPDGLKLFEEYLSQEDLDRFHMLKFWYACRGVAQQDAITADKAVRVIYKQLFLKITSGVKDEVKSAVAHQMRAAKCKSSDSGNPILLTAAIFSDACKIVEKEMNEVMYPNFLRSDVYLNYVQKMQGDCCSADDSSREALVLPEEQDEQDDELPKSFSQPLPVVDEEKELSLDEDHRGKHRSSYAVSSYLGSTSMSRLHPRRANSPNLRLHHYSYTQNSELQSLSSGARNDSIMDLTLDDATSSKNPYVYQRQLQTQLHQGSKIRINPNPDRDNLILFTPRTAQPEAKEHAKPRSPTDFARELIDKLEKVKQKRDSYDRFGQKYSTIEGDRNLPIDSEYGPALEQQSSVDTIMPKIDEDDQEILDKHVSRIWSDKTPKRSPCVGTPVRPKSPDTKKQWPAHSKFPVQSFAPSPYAGSGPTKPKAKDLVSLFSVDSGNYTDPTESSYYSRRHAPKNKSMSECGKSAEHYFPGYCQRSNKSWANSRRTLSDSGFSDVSKPYAPTSHKERMVSSWLSDNNKISRNLPVKGAGFAAACFEEKEAAMAFASSKQRTKSSSGHSHYSSRSKGGTSDHGIASSSSKNAVPGHPFIQDQGIPPFRYHGINTDIQLEETRRRLEEQQQHASRNLITSQRSIESGARSVYSLSSAKTEMAQPKAATLTRSYHKSGSGDDSTKCRSVSGDESVFTTVLYNFSDEQMPYLLKVPGNPITLKLFKEYMPPKKVGQYRYFFVKPCEDLDNQPIQEEIVDDNEVLPLWKGKVNAQIKAIE